MPSLSDKVILVLSPQSWGKMLVSKHHYAIELARRGNKVFFLDPPEVNNWTKGTTIDIVPVEGIENLSLVKHRIFFPYVIKFKALPVFHFLMRKQISRILKKLPPLDIVWSFDLGNLYRLDDFGKSAFKIFHPVDEPLNRPAIAAAKGADVIFSVTNEILEKYNWHNAQKHFVNHGVSDVFFHPDEHKGDAVPTQVNAGFSGNLLRPDIDRETLLTIVEQNPNVHFHLWGSYASKDANIGGTVTTETDTFIAKLKASSNVTLYGAVPVDTLAAHYREMDLFLICYDVQKDQSKGTNYHKILEFLSTGKVVVSNNVTTYKDLPVLVSMISERTGNSKLPQLFKTVVEDLSIHNSLSNQTARRDYAKENSYSKQIFRIEQIIRSVKE